MRIKQGKKLHQLGNENIVVSVDDGETDLTTVVGLNESAALLFKELSSIEFENEDVAAVLLKYYEVDEVEAMRDAVEWVQNMKRQGLVVD